MPVRCRYCKAFSEVAALENWSSQDYIIIPSPKICSAITQVFKYPGCSTSTVLESSCLVNFSLGERKRYFQLKSPLEKRQRQGDRSRACTSHLQYVSSCKRRLCWQDDSCSVCCHSAFSPALGRRPSKYNRLLWQGLECPAVLGSLPEPGLLKQRERGAGHGKGSKGAGRKS